MEVNQHTNPNFTAPNTDDVEVISFQDLLNRSSAEDNDDEVEFERTEEEDPLDNIKLPLDIPAEEEEEETIKVNPKEVDAIPTKTEEESPVQKVEYKSIIKKLWGDDIEMLSETDEEGNEIEVLLDDANVDEDKFLNIVKSKLAEIEDKYKGRVNTEEVSEFTKHLINIESNGGSVKEAIQLYQTYKDPLASLDLDDEQDQITAIIMRHQAVGTEESIIGDLIDTYRAKGVLKEKSFTAKEELERAVDDKVAALEQEAVNRRKAHEDNLKRYTKDVKTVVSTLNIKDSIKNKIVEASTKKDSSNQYLLDKLYNEVRLDPAKVAEMALYLVDRETFIQTVSAKEVIKEKKETLKKLKLIPTKEKTNNNRTGNNDSESISLTELTGK